MAFKTSPTAPGPPPLLPAQLPAPSPQPPGRFHMPLTDPRPPSHSRSPFPAGPTPFSAARTLPDPARRRPEGAPAPPLAPPLLLLSTNHRLASPQTPPIHPVPASFPEASIAPARSRSLIGPTPLHSDQSRGRKEENLPRPHSPLPPPLRQPIGARVAIATAWGRQPMGERHIEAARGGAGGMVRPAVRGP